jgi:hypothetical protein
MQPIDRDLSADVSEIAKMIRKNDADHGALPVRQVLDGRNVALDLLHPARR